jgi:DNA-binding response OmpR family regulator
MATVKRVLIVEDDHQLLEIFAEMFRGLGYETYMAMDAAEALVLANHVDPHVIFVDQNLGEGEPGSSLISYLRLHLRVHDATIVGVSGRPDSKQKLLDAGADGFILKPFTLRRLGGEVADVLMKVALTKPLC